MSPRGVVAFVLIVSGGAAAQGTPAPAVPAPAAGEAAAFRDTADYRYPALSQTVRDMQNLAYAMQLRDYCADPRVPDEFLKAQLARFGRITGRSETCKTLLSY